MQTNNETDRLKQELSLDKKPKARIWRWLVLLIVLAAAGYAVWYFFLSSPSNKAVYDIGKASTGDIRVTVSATGTLQPTNEVEVGSELSGTIDEVLVDYNDKVEVGQLLARLNTDKLQAQVLQSKAALQVAEAGVLEADATLKESIAQYDRLKEVRKMSGGKLPSKADLIAAEATMKRAKAAKQTAKAQVEQAKASLEQYLTDISKAKIVSPINGIVLIRSIEVGQTVAASMTAPVLFTLAEDLTKMELQVDVDEADVGLVEAGQNATFTVDAYPNQNFPAKIKQVRYGAESSDGVVTYTTLLEVDNPEVKLRPGMTATADILVKEKSGILMIPVAALRFTPELLNNGTQQTEKSVIQSLMPRPGRSNGVTIKKEAVENGYQRVWKLVNGQPQPLLIKIGESSGSKVEVVEGDLKAGDELIVGVEVSLK
ncbi:efflux RND transporter periplasmic adaptor subunit [Thiomicrorhabdus heinhorstiae]|uniref:Efflux RND transporter periplasmic adaptor subunit n=1 Tax=Thiomicrorhabdus heinhorstiae TaxID=2748010 RepID=A0ABS0BTE0_9GAMM|nr:efflux RND transporter periplasmic adaptor subunit [Thiomicrorhabdus heinhorstiae]MBF6057064.1 efflux RND transporter periplasmic adaptor subunit [Thiomicrorhabdus heinhorstiae]